MNAQNIYSELQDQNDRLLNLRGRLRRTIMRICGSPPPRGPEVAGLSATKPGESTFLNDLEAVSMANSEILLDLGNDLLWLESTFGTAEMDEAKSPYPITSSR